MSSDTKAWYALTAWSVLLFVIGFAIGFAIGDKSSSQSLEREIIELSIELTELEIQKLKGEG